ncbi:MAG: GldG family protein [Treponema sp.]|nr:GldG family protein [Treponema sp.]
MKALYRRYLFSLLIRPAVFAASALFVLYAVLQFFFVQQFFTEAGTTELHRFFAAIPYAAVLYIPVLASVLPSGDSGYAQPFPSAAISLAKILSLLTVAAFSLLLTSVVPLTVHFFGDVELRSVCCAYLGLLLYLAAAVSFCVFISGLLPHAGAAFFASAALLAASCAAHLAAAWEALPGWLAACCRAVSFAWHFDAAGKGIIDTRDCLFYAAVTVFFWLAAVACMERKRGRRGSMFWKQLALLAAACPLLAADASRLYARIDVTAAKTFTVSAYSRTLLAEVSEPLSITYYRSGVLKSLYPQVRDVDDFLRSYAACSPQLSYTLLDPSGEKLEQRLAQYGIEGRQLRTEGQGASAYMTVYSAVVLSYLDRTEVIPFVLGTASLEYDLAGRVQYLVQGRIRAVQVLTGNGLELSEDYQYVCPFLESQGFFVLQASLPSQRDEAGRGDVFTLHGDVPVLLLGSSALTAEDADALLYFIQKGGKLVAASQPYTIDLQKDWSVQRREDVSGYFSDDRLAWLLRQFGVYFRDTLTADSLNFLLALEGSGSAQTEYVSYPLWPQLPRQEHAVSGMTLFWPCAFDVDDADAAAAGFSVAAVLRTSSGAWQEMPVAGDFITNPFSATTAAPAGAESGSFPVCVALSPLRAGGAAAAPSVYVLGDQYAASDFGIAYSSGSGGGLDVRSLSFLVDCLLSVSGDAELVALKNRSIRNTSLYKIRGDSFLPAARRAVFADCVIILVILSLLYICTAMQRRRFNEKTFC